MSWIIVTENPAKMLPTTNRPIPTWNRSLPPVQVAELAEERRRDRLREQVGGDDPRELVEAAEVADDRGERGGHDRLVDRRQQHAQDQAAEDDHDLPLGQRLILAYSTFDGDALHYLHIVQCFSLRKQA